MKSKIENPKSKILEWEVLPPEGKAERRNASSLFKWLAFIMDELLRLPGTNFRFGLDPLIGLVPGLGDTSSALISALALVQAARLGVPKIALVRMSLNILINEIVGIVPVVGDAFSFWFKSNVRNYEIIKSHSTTPGRSRRSDWIFVAGVLITLVLIVGCGILSTFLVIRTIGNWLGVF